mmetsp:Transcript_17394/g.48052  ORF Transcript_17394/g.48052 Transcript_17394/m.48052 type:complete len:130 (+) Transcript_17394:1802-2191(+)
MQAGSLSWEFSLCAAAASLSELHQTGHMPGEMDDTLQLEQFDLKSAGRLRRTVPSFWETLPDSSESLRPSSASAAKVPLPLLDGFLLGCPSTARFMLFCPSIASGGGTPRTPKKCAEGSRDEEAPPTCT